MVQVVITVSNHYQQQQYLQGFRMVVKVLPLDRSSVVSFDSNRWSEGSEQLARLGAAQVQVAAQSRQHGQGEVAEDHRGCWVRQASEAESVGGQTSLV